MNQRIVRVLNNVLFLLVAVFSVGYFAGIEVEKVNATETVTAPTGFISQTYEDSDGNGVIDQVVIVIDNGGESLTACSVTDAEVVADWTYVGNDIGGLLASTGDTHSCDLGTETITLKIVDANENTTGHTTAPTIAYGGDSDDSDDSIANTIGNLIVVAATDITDGAAPVMISAIYKDTGVDPDGIVDRIEVAYSEDIGSSIFTEGEWSFPDNPHSLDIDSVTFSMTDVYIKVISSDPDDNLTVINNTIVGYTAIATTDVDGGIIDGAGNYAEDATFSVSAEGDEEDDEDDEDEDYIQVPDYGHERLKQPNPNSGVILYRVDGDPRVYVIKNKKKHWIHTPKEFEAGNYSWSAVQIVSAETIEEYPDAETLATELLRAVGSHKVYKIENGKKRWIKTAGEFNAAGYKWKDIKDVSPEDLASYQNEVSSELIRATGSYKVYRIENGKKRWIKTAGEFNAAGLRWENVEDVTVEILDNFPNTETL